MMESKRACVYTRVSTEAQAEKEISLEEQDRMARAAIVSKGWEYVGTYQDAGFSGRNMNRPALQQLIQDIQDKKIDAVVIFKLDRLSRRQRDCMAIVEDTLLANNVELVSLSETLDTSTPWGRAMIGVLASFNQLECDNIKERTSTCRNAKARDGGYAGGRPPYGYRSVNGSLVIEETEAEAVRIAFKLRDDFRPYQFIADHLNRGGYKTRTGGKFYSSTVRQILSNENVYRGEYSYGSAAHGVKGAHKAILAEGV